jgi:membrane fusion protein, multidrug efflux system
VPIELDAIPGVRLAGSLRRIFPGADPASRLTTVEIELPVDANERGVRPGFLARVRMPIDPRPEVIAISTAAIGEDGGERYVLVIAEGRLHRRAIEPGVTRGQWTEVLSGLEAGEIVLATNPVDMSEGQAVRIVGWRG